jgi:hypothetical protein
MTFSVSARRSLLICRRRAADLASAGQVFGVPQVAACIFLLILTRAELREISAVSWRAGALGSNPVFSCYFVPRGTLSD